MREVAIIHNDLLTAYVEPVLLRSGFSRTRHTFLKWNADGCLWRVGVLLTSLGGQATMLPTVGVGFRDIAAFLSRCVFLRIRADPNEPCAMATDLGRLMPGGRYLEIPISPSSDVNSLGPQVRDSIERYALPFLENFGTLEKALRAWESGVTYNLGANADYYIAAAYWLRREKSRALSLIQERIEYYDKRAERRTDARDRDDRRRFKAFLLSAP